MLLGLYSYRLAACKDTSKLRDLVQSHKWTFASFEDNSWLYGNPCE